MVSGPLQTPTAVDGQVSYKISFYFSHNSFSPLLLKHILLEYWSMLWIIITLYCSRNNDTPKSINIQWKQMFTSNIFNPWLVKCRESIFFFFKTREYVCLVIVFLPSSLSFPPSLPFPFSLDRSYIFQPGFKLHTVAEADSGLQIFQLPPPKC